MLYRYALAAFLLLFSVPAWGHDSHEDGLSHAAEVSRSRDQVFVTHGITDQYPGPPSPLGPSGSPSNIALADMDGDGSDDLIASWESILGDGEIYWYRNRLPEESRDFAFESLLLVDDVLSRQELLALDLDGDEDPDIVSMSADPLGQMQDEVVWHENRLDEETADFGPGVSIPASGLGTIGVAGPILFEDLDGDEDLDFVWAGDRLAWSENRLDEAGVEDFGPAREIDSHSPIGAFPPSAQLRAADLDRDGDSDLVYWTLQECRMAWYENRLDEASTDIALGGVIVGGPSGAVLVGLTDLDSDGWPDPLGSSYVVMGDRPCGGEAESLHWYPNQLNEEPPGFAAPAPIAELAMAFVEAADLDGDEDPDLVGGHFDGLGTDLLVHQNRLGESGDDFPPMALDYTMRGSQVAFSDLDLDGDIDFVTISNDSAEGDSPSGAVWVANPGTDPTNPDSDGDTWLDGEEVEAGSDPNDPASTPVPEPGAGMSALAALATLAAIRLRHG